MNNTIRGWYPLGNIVVLIDYELRGPVAFIEIRLKEESYTTWTPNQDLMLHEFVARTNLKSQVFNYNPHDVKDTNETLNKAMSWCETIVGPPCRRVNLLQFLIHAVMFWKYDLIWEGPFPIAIRAKKYKIPTGETQNNG